MMYNTRVRLAHANRFMGTAPTLELLHDLYFLNPTKWIKESGAKAKLLSLGDDLRARPRSVTKIFMRRRESFLHLSFDDERTVECPVTQSFLINNVMQNVRNARPGDTFESVLFKSVVKGQNRGIGTKKEVAEFRIRMAGQPCEDCGLPATENMEIHHNDLNGGHDRPADLAWLHNKCHKLRHTTDRQPFSHGLILGKPAVLQTIERLDMFQPFCLRMEKQGLDGQGNYVLANGIVTAND